MTQTSRNPRNIIITSIVVVVLLISLVAALIEYNQSAPTRIVLNLVDNPTEMLQGSSTQFKVLVSSFGKVGDITLSSDVGSSGINCTFEPVVCTSNFTVSTVTINVPDSTPAGNYTVTIVASGDGQQAKNSSALQVLSANLNAGDIVVSGRASSAPLFMPFPSSLISITFTDTQTDANTTYDFNFPPPPTPNPFGNYTVILMNQHNYNVTVSYYGNMVKLADYVGTFTVAVPAGQTAITKDF
jgi:hypothetical protein